MLRETLKSFGAVEDSLQYTNATDDIINFPCWSKEEDKDINEAYEGIIEVENGDKASLSVASVSEADNRAEEEKTEEKLYTDKDMKDAEDLF
jgi:hypothetical protein